MMVTFVSQCEHKALNRTRRVLDAFANRIGTNTRRAILPHEILGTPVTKYSLTYGANWISPSSSCVRFNYAQKPLR